MTDRLADMLTALKHGKDPRFVAATVEWVPVVGGPVTRAYHIAGPNKGAVQAAITALQEDVEENPGGGFAQFLHPWRSEDGVWRSRGEVVLYEPEAAR